MRKHIAIAAAIVAALVLIGTFFVSMRSTSGDAYAQCRTSAVAGGESLLGGPFELVNSAGETVTDRDVITEPSLLYFGYTYCPDVCPLDVDRNAAAVDILAERGHDVTPVFITVDPARDAPQVVGDFAENMHPKMIGLTGSDAQIRAASQAYRTYYKLHEPVDGEYLVDHSAFSYLVFPQDGFVEFFRRDLPPEQLADRMQCFLERR